MCLIFVILIVYIGFTNWNVIQENMDLSKGNKIIDGECGVSSSSPIATKVGMEILENGGNAVDAAIAVSYVLGVVEPWGSGIGGGGGMLIYDYSNDKFDFFNYRDSAPISSSKKLSNIGVPGFVKGMEEIHKYYGTIDIKELIEPAINYAKNGFKIDYVLEEQLKRYEKYYISDDFYDDNGKILKYGDTFIQNDLAETLREIKQNGSNAFYEGSIADKIVSNSTLTKEDLKNYKVDRLEPVKGMYLGYEIVSAPAPFSGVTLIQMLKIFEKIGISNPDYDIESYIEDLKFISNITAADRVNNITDPNFYNVNNNYLVSDEYIDILLKKGRVAYKEDKEHESTTHFVVLDKDGMIVSATNTLGGFWGSKESVAGIYLNETLNNFSSTSGNINSYEPGKIPRNFTAPTIIKKGDDYIIGIGSPGGSKIIKILAPVLLNILQFGTDIKTAVDKPRVVFIDEINLAVEDRKSIDFVKVKNNNYIISEKKNRFYFGSVQAIGISSEEGMFSVIDDRRNGFKKYE